MFCAKYYDNNMKEDEKGGNVAGMGKNKMAFKVLIEKIRMQQASWENNTDWIHVIRYSDQWRALANMVLNLQIPQKPENFLAV